MSKKKLSNQKPAESSDIDQDDLKKHIDKNEAQQKVLEKIAQILKEKKNIVIVKLNKPDASKDTDS